MTGILRVDTIQNSNTSTIITQTNSTTITIGTSGQTVALAAGSSSSGFGATYNGAVNWDTTPKTANFTAVSGEGYFANTSGGAFTMSLPAGSAGAIVSVADYTNSFQTNALTITPNGSEKINGGVGSIILNTEGQSLTLLYVDSTEGWKSVQDSTTSPVGNNFITATGGTITTCGDFKIHSFTGPGTFTVTSVGNPLGSTTVDYLVVAGGGAGANKSGGGGGAGGFRQSFPNPATAGFPVTAQAYPITVGGGGTGVAPAVSGAPGNPSIFSTITSAGGGGGGRGCVPAPCAHAGLPGGSGGGGGGNCQAGTGGTGNTPPVAPPQGNSGGTGNASAPGYGAAGGGGAGGTGGNGSSSSGGAGGAGSASSITGSPVTRGGGGGGGSYATGGAAGPGGGGAGVTIVPVANPGTINTGGGGGGTGPNSNPAGSGGSGIVIIRYKYQ
jgi:hypothetical protein